MLNHQSQTQKSKFRKIQNRKGFTMVEIILTVSIVALLMVIITVVINPVEQLYRAQDGHRIDSLNTLDNALRVIRSDIGGSFDPDGNYDGDATPSTQSCSGDADQRVFVSVPSDNGESDPTDLPIGWKYARVTNAALRNTDGTGWLPVDFSTSTVVNFTHLPADPLNTFVSDNYYTYVCNRAPSGFELTASMQSKKFQSGGSQDIQSTDGGDNTDLFETGPDLELYPISQWPV